MRAFLFAAFLALYPIASPAAPTTYTGRAQVIDGDTIGIEGVATRFRLDAIDAPESSQPCYDASGARYLCGSRAAESLADIIGRNGRVSCTEKERDRYGRIVAVCSTAPAGQQAAVELNREMVARGWAVEYTKYSDGRYAAASAEAKAAKRGVWQGAFDMPWDWRKGKRTPATTSAALGAMAAATVSKPAPATTTATSCKSAKTCRDAVILWCGGYRRADRDGDGIPCESVCKSLSQVAALKKQVACEADADDSGELPSADTFNPPKE